MRGGTEARGSLSIDGISPPQDLSTRFQPIVDLRTGLIGAYEALSRGPQGTRLEPPRALLGAAAEAGRLSELVRACWRLAIEAAVRQRAPGGALPTLFFNVLPEGIGDALLFDEVQAGLERARIEPSGLVLEVTESGPVRDYPALLHTLARYRAAGIRVAVDNMGARHAGERLVAEVEPDFVKVARPLVEEVDGHPGRRGAVEALLLLAEKVGAEVVAEGIEREEELEVVRGLGVPLAQGFLLGRPEEQFLPADALRTTRLRSLSHAPARNRPAHLEGAARIGEYLERAPAVPMDCPLEDALRLLEGTEADAVVLVEDGRPRALASRRRIHEQMARPYGREVFLRRPVERVADPDPLIVDWRTPLETVSRLAMARSSETLYDDVVVARAGRYLGVVSLRRLLDAITRSRLEMARHSNPLTGLPGNQIIHEVIRSRLQGPSGAGVLHIDLDDFKAFNDAHGFHRGDDAIRLTAAFLQEVVAAHGGAHPFLGHVGGDDFVAVVALDAIRPIRKAIEERFQARVRSLFTGSGEPPRLGISVGAVLISGDDPRSVDQVLHSLAAAKRQAKSRKGGGRGEDGSDDADPPVVLVAV